MGMAPRRSPTGRAPAAGLTLVEVLIAASVLTIAILGMASAFPTGLLQVSYGGQITKATSLAHQMMEDIRSDPSYFIAGCRGIAGCVGPAAGYAGKNGGGVSTNTPANFPDDWPGSCTSGSSSGDTFCGNAKLTRWRQDITGDPGDGRKLAQGTGTVTVVDHENPVPGGGAAVSGSTSILRITVTVSWNDQTGRRQVTLTSTVPCLRLGCS